MKKYLAIFLGSAKALEDWKKMDEEMRKKKDKLGMDAWMKWLVNNKKSIVDDGSPLGKTKKVTAGGIVDTKNEMGAYTIIEAESHEEAAKLFENHPHFMIFPGESIEIMECIPMPTM